MATADQTQINTVTQARELYTNSVEDERHEATVDRANDWVSKISQLVRLNATSSNGLAQSLADAIRNMATQYPVTTIGGMSALGQPMGVSQANPFWMALADKAELAADYLSSVNRAQTNYLTGRTEIVGGDVAIMLPGMLQHQADLRISQSAATRDYNKATVEAAGQRDRTLANARTNLAAAKGTWEQGLVSQTDTNTTVEKPSLDPPTTQPPSTASTARQLSTLFSGGLVSAEPAPQQNGTSNADATDEDLETIPIDETPAPIDPPPTWSPPSLAELAPDLASQGLNPPLPEVPVAAIESKPVTPSLPPLTILPEDALTELDLAIIDAELAGDQLRDDLHEAWKKKSKDLWDKYGSIPGLATLHRDLVSGFANGLLVDGLWGDIEGIGSLIGGTASYLWDTTDGFGRSLGEGWHGYFSGDPLHKGFGEYGEEAFEDELEFIDRAMEAAESLRDGLKNADKEKSRFEEALRESMAGHPEKLDAMLLEYGDVGKLTGLLIRNLMYEIGTWAIEEGIDPETAGRIAGYLAYEALLAAASGGIKALAESGQAAKWLDRVADSAATNSAENATLIMRFLRRPGVRNSLSGLASIGWALTSKLCFVAGTPVRTPSGSVAIESLKVGDLVLSRSDRGGLAGDVRSRRVTALHVTNPIELLHLTLSTVGGASASVRNWGHPNSEAIVVVCSANKTGWTLQSPCTRTCWQEGCCSRPGASEKNAALLHPFCARREQRLCRRKHECHALGRRGWR